MRKSKSNSKVIPLLAICVLSAANILFVRSDAWKVEAGTPIDISSLPADAYQVASVRQLSDGGYLVTSMAEGYQSDIEVGVTFDDTGKVIRSVAIISQAETPNIGGKVAAPEFLQRFDQIEAPVGLTGEEMSIASPGSGLVWGEAPEVTTEAVLELIDPADWNADDQSAEANAARALYESGLLSSASTGQPIQAAPADYGPEERARYELQQAGLTVTTEIPVADYSPEDAAAYRLKTAGLTDSASANGGSTENYGGSLTEVDAVSGATISSKAVVTAVDQAFFFVNENIIAE